MNAQSSRSHAIFSVTLLQQSPANNSGPVSPNTPMSPLSPTSPSTPNRLSGSPPPRAGSRMSRRNDDGEWVYVTSKFHFVDLAGSERVKHFYTSPFSSICLFISIPQFNESYNSYPSIIAQTYFSNWRTCKGRNFNQFRTSRVGERDICFG